MKNLYVWGSAFALAAAVGALPLASAIADQHEGQAATAAYEEAMAECEKMSNEAAKAECSKKAQADLDAAMEAAKKK